MKKFLTAVIFLLGLNSAVYSAEKAIQVTQPAYHSMKFYVYKPVNLPKDFYVTFDGYLVYKDAQGIWNYGSNEKSGLTKTRYVVGSVIPSVVRLKPYSTKISSVAPLLKTESAESSQADMPKSARIIYMPPASGLEIYNAPVLSPHNPDWTQNSNFMAVGKWQNSIDRIGVTSRPMMPVAWKGDYPEVIYAWTGLHWKQLAARTSHTTALSTLRRGMYDLNKYARKVNMLNWTNDDTHVLSQYAVMWGYEWMGLVIIGKEY